MELSNEQITKYTKRIMRSRMRLLCNYGFYGLLLMHIIFTIDIKTDTIWTDGIRIGLNPSFLDELSDDELDYVFMHEILHIALDHGKRRCNFDEKKYDIAADIVVNSIIFSSSGYNVNSIYLRNYDGEQPHIAPNGEEGYKYTVEEVYALLSGLRKATTITSQIKIHTRILQKMKTEMNIKVKLDLEMEMCMMMKMKAELEMDMEMKMKTKMKMVAKFHSAGVAV